MCELEAKKIPYLQILVTFTEGKKEYDGTFSQKIAKGRVEICPLLSKIQGCFTLAIIVHQALT